MSDTEVTHRCPRTGESLTPCCRRVPFELPHSDRITTDDDLVTCGKDDELVPPGWLPGSVLVLPTSSGDDAHVPMGFRLIVICSCGKQHEGDPS